MRLTVLGCWGGSPRAGGACSGYLLEHAGQRLLLDCGAGAAGKLAQACPLDAVHHVVVSHAHYDHVSDAGALMYARLVARQVRDLARAGDVCLAAAGVAVAGKDTGTGAARAATSDSAGAAGGTPNASPALDPLPELAFYAQGGTPELDTVLACLAMSGASRPHAIDAGTRLQVGPFALAFARTRHAVPCLAVRVTASDGSVLAYTADGALTPELARFCAGADVLVSECSLYPGFDGAASGHMSCEDVVRLAREALPRTLVLSHLPVYGDPRVLLRHVRGGVPKDEVPEVLLACESALGQELLSIDVNPLKEGARG